VIKRLVPLAGVVLVVAGCGSGGSSSSSSSSGNGQRPNQAAFVKFQDCLKKQGVTFQRPQRSGNGAPPANGQRPQGQRPTLSAKQQKAFQACAKYRPQFGGNGNGGGYGPPPGGGGYGGPPPGQSQ
jgi:hypothetical protein